jgi:hypothetical protein
MEQTRKLGQDAIYSQNNENNNLNALQVHNIY